MELRRSVYSSRQAGDVNSSLLSFCSFFSDSSLFLGSADILQNCHPEPQAKDPKKLYFSIAVSGNSLIYFFASVGSLLKNIECNYET